MKRGTGKAVAAALVCIAAGCVFMGIGAAAGGVEQVKTGEFDLVHPDSFSDLDFDFGGVLDLLPLKSTERGRYDGETATKDIEVLSGDFDRTIEYSGRLEKLEIEVGVHILEIREGGGPEILLEGKNCDRVQCYVEKGTLYLKDVGKNKKYVKIRDRELVLTVPEDICWDETQIGAALGGVEADALDAQEIELDANMGNIVIDSLTAERLRIEADMGNVELTNARAGGLEVEANMGNIEFEGIVDGDVEAAASMGSILLELWQQESDFDYKISAGMGGVTLDGADYSGLSHEKKLDNGAGRQMKLESSMGSIDIYFE